MRFPHGNDPTTAISRRPYDHDHPAVQQADREKAVLACPVGRNGQSWAGEDLAHQRHIQPAILERGFALRRIERDLHSGGCYYINERMAILL